MNFDQERFLSAVWTDFSHIPGWVFAAEDLFKLSGEDVCFLEQLDDIMIESTISHLKWISSDEMSFERLLFDNGDPDSSDESKIGILSEYISEFYVGYAEAKKRDESLVPWLFGETQIKKMEKLRRKLRARNCHTTPSAFSVSEAEIVKAREFPLEKLVELDRDNKMICPFHEDTSPSFFVRGGWGYCFSCGASADAIKWLMTTQNMTFVDAVRSLQT
jgi:hypothetical protein